MEPNRTVPQSRDILLETMVILGGGRYRGMLKPGRDRNGKHTEPIVLFNSPATGSTLALPVSKVSARAVRERIEKSNAEFEAYAEKACTRVLSQFAIKEAA